MDGFEPFLPKIDPELSERRFAHHSRAARVAVGSSYVVHLPDDGSQQVLYMKFTDMPEDIQMGIELSAVSSDPKLTGLVREFRVPPKQYRSGGDHPGQGKRGSQIAANGILWDVKKVDTNMLGGVTLSLLRSKSCDIREVDFYDDVRPYICLPEQE